MKFLIFSSFPPQQISLFKPDTGIANTFRNSRVKTFGQRSFNLRPPKSLRHSFCGYLDGYAFGDGIKDRRIPRTHHTKLL